MRAISLWQPWAEAIRRGDKWIETRHWKPPAGIVGQRIAIHAAKKPITRPIIADLDTMESWRWLFIGSTGQISQLNYGGIVATAILEQYRTTEFLVKYDYVSVETQFEDDIEAQFPYGDFSRGRFGWILRDIRPTQFVAVKGRQGFFNVPDSKILEGGSN